VISFAQNFEDVILERLFKDVDDGFYIDVGAHHPEIDSVTKHFYDKGWSGINIEPLVENWTRFAEFRPRDINLDVALGDHDGEAVLNVVTELGYSSFERKYADKARGVGTRCRERSVQVRRLDTITEAHQVSEAHFLKIDVEGAEAKVLAGWDPAKFRPIVVVIESTVPMSSEPNYESWEWMLTRSDYSFQYFDGINRFYLRDESSELADCFRLPPNVFDGFVLAREIRAQGELVYAKAHAFRWLGAKGYGYLRSRVANLWDTVAR
jgi:FkbM family methyltransferase